MDLGLAAKVRPALILSVPYGDEDRALVTIVPPTTAPRGTRFEAGVVVPGLEEGVFDAQGLPSVPTTVLIRRRGTLALAQLGAVERVVRLWLGLHGPQGQPERKVRILFGEVREEMP